MANGQPVGEAAAAVHAALVDAWERGDMDQYRSLAASMGPLTEAVQREWRQQTRLRNLEVALSHYPPAAGADKEN